MDVYAGDELQVNRTESGKYDTHTMRTFQHYARLCGWTNTNVSGGLSHCVENARRSISRDVR
jgi:hypothetical protein